MIEIKSGNISLIDNDIIIHSDLKKYQLMNSRFYREHIKSENDMGNSYIWCYFKPLKIFELNMCISICFYQDDLFCIDMSAVGDDFPTSWNNWTEEYELKRKKTHDELLKQIFMRDADENKLSPYPVIRYIFDWGEVYSSFDSKSGSSKIRIKYMSCKS